MKKWLAIILCMVMALGTLAACGGSDKDSSGTPAGDANAADRGDNSAGDTAGNDEKGEPDTIKMTYLTTGNTPADVEKVRAAINEISVAEINVEVDFTILSVPESFSNYSLWISSGEEIDLMCIAFSDMASYVSSGQLKPVDDLIDAYAPGIKSLMETYPITEGTIFDGQAYGVSPVALNYGSQCAYIIDSSYLDEIGLARKDKYTLDELTDIFAAIKEKHPDMYPANILGSGITNGGTYYSYVSPYDPLGASSMSGVIMDMDSTEIVNLYEQDEYYAYLETVRGWYEAGYIMTDAATTDTLSEELIKSGVTVGYFMHNKPEMAADATSTYGTQFEALSLSDPFRIATSSSGGTFWTVPITCKNDEAAMKFLDLVMSNSEVSNLFKNGIEGEHYTLTDVEGVIDVVDSNIYGGILGVYGDRRFELSANQGATRADHDAFTNAAAENTSVAAGYMYNSSKMSNQLVAIQSVLAEYQASLETGSVSDLENVYQEFLSRLKSAGINDVIADNQSQFDAWRAEQ